VPPPGKGRTAQVHVAIMQPYFLPYIGYFQLIAAVDRFVIYDTIQYTKKGWINRNRMLRNGEAVMFSLPLRKASDFLDVRQRELAEEFSPSKLLAQFEGAYRKAPYFGEIAPLLASILAFPDRNLFAFVRNSIEACCRRLRIETPVLVASEIEAEAPLSGADRVLDICRRLGADRYTNPIGGMDLYRPSLFGEQGIELRFLRSREEPYTQFGGAFVPFLSIVDVMMFNPPERIDAMLRAGYDLLEGRDAPDVPLA
jgi:hypothetical protein